MTKPLHQMTTALLFVAFVATVYGDGPMSEEAWPKFDADGNEVNEGDQCIAPSCTGLPAYVGLCEAHAEEEFGPANPTVEELVGPLCGRGDWPGEVR